MSSKGCASALGIVMATAFVASSFSMCGKANQMNPAGPSAVTGNVVVTVAGKPVTGETIELALAQQREQMGGMALPPEQAATFTGYAITSALTGAAMEAVAAKNGIEFKDADIKSAFDKQFQAQVDQFRQQMEMQKKLKPGASEAELMALIEKEVKKPLSKIKEDAWKQISDALADPQKRGQVLQGFAQPMLVEALAAKAAPSDSDLLSTYNTLTVKRVLLKDENGKSAVTEAERIRNEISGGLKFEDAMNRYSKEIPLPNKRVSENTLTVSGRQFSEDVYRPLAGLKAGDVSVPVTTPEGVVIYKVVSIKADVPPDFEKNKTKYREQLAKERGEAEMRRQTDAILKGADVKWQSPGYEALFKLSNDQASPDPKVRQSNLEAVAKLAEDALVKAQGGERKVASLALFGALSQLATLPGADAKALSDRKISAINSILESEEDAALRLQLVDLYTEKGDKLAASDALLKAAQYNSDYTPQGQTRYSDLQAKLRTLTQKGFVDAKAEAAIKKEFDRWLKEKITFEKQQAEQKAADEAAAKKAAEEAKNAKGTGSAPKSDYSPSSTPTNPPKTGN
jgi:hypothetical protein